MVEELSGLQGFFSISSRRSTNAHSPKRSIHWQSLLIKKIGKARTSLDIFKEQRISPMRNGWRSSSKKRDLCSDRCIAVPLYDLISLLHNHVDQKSTTQLEH